MSTPIHLNLPAFNDECTPNAPPTPTIEDTEDAKLVEVIVREIERYGQSLVPELRIVTRWLADHFRTEEDIREDIRTRIDAICGCRGRNNCDCVSVFNKARSAAWGEYNSALLTKGTPS